MALLPILERGNCPGWSLNPKEQVVFHVVRHHCVGQRRGIVVLLFGCGSIRSVLWISGVVHLFTTLHWWEQCIKCRYSGVDRERNSDLSQHCAHFVSSRFFLQFLHSVGILQRVLQAPAKPGLPSPMLVIRLVFVHFSSVLLSNVVYGTSKANYGCFFFWIS